MLVRFTKGPVAARADLLTCVRRDRSITSGEMPRQGVLPHDVIHFVVETTLGWREAFFGAIARGVSLDHIASRKSRTDWSQWPQALQAESLVECLQAEQWGGSADPLSFRRILATACRVRGVAVPVLSPEDLRRVRAALREFGAAWRPLPAGGTLEKTF
jgi:hypothetical protein